MKLTKFDKMNDDEIRLEFVRRQCESWAENGDEVYSTIGRAFIHVLKQNPRYLRETLNVIYGEEK